MDDLSKKLEDIRDDIEDLDTQRRILAEGLRILDARISDITKYTIDLRRRMPD